VRWRPIWFQPILIYAAFVAGSGLLVMFNPPQLEGVAKEEEVAIVKILMEVASC
jgi:hypothetical protein